MAHQVRINRGAIEAENRIEFVDRSEWRQLLAVRRTFVRTHVPHDCQQLVRFVHDAEQMFAPLGFSSVDDFVRNGLEIDPDVVQWALTGLGRLRPEWLPSTPIPLATAVAAGMAEKVEAAPTLAAHGVNRFADRVDTINSTTGGTGSAYRIGRVKREAAAGNEQAVEALAAAARGEVKSAAELERRAGIARPPPPPLTVALRYIAKVPDDERAMLFEACRERGWL